MSTPASPLPRQKLPIGLQTLREIREDGYYYVDKSGVAVDLIESGKAYFLSRPRRFGKSLLVDTLKELFEGNRALFTGLAAETRWDWSRRYPVIRISFGGGMTRSAQDLDYRIQANLRANRAALGLPLPADVPLGDVAGNLACLIEQAHRQFGQPAVVLVDEYDKPILDCITDPDTARLMRDGLRNLYAVLKEADAHLKFVFLTGVSKFSKVSLFSGLNNLRDITLDARWSALCGYTDHDLDTVFAPELHGLDRDEIRRWYNGYNWLGTAVYNPFDVLLLFDRREFKAYWFETGTPTFLVELLAQQQFFTPELHRLHSDEGLLSAFDVDHISAEALLFQTGYLTIHHATPGSSEEEPVYTLGYPNREVEASLNRVLLVGYGVPERPAFHARQQLGALLKAVDLPGLETLFRSLFASIPHDWYRNNPLAQFEGHYASVFYSHFAALGLDIRVEDTTNHGRIDMTVLAYRQVFIFEFKVVDTAAQGLRGEALRQIHQCGYPEKYRTRGEPVHLIGVAFSRLDRNVVGFETETLPTSPITTP